MSDKSLVLIFAIEFLLLASLMVVIGLTHKSSEDCTCEMVKQHECPKP
jgi:hypothetical protein